MSETILVTGGAGDIGRRWPGVFWPAGTGSRCSTGMELLSKRPPGISCAEINSRASQPT